MPGTVLGAVVHSGRDGLPSRSLCSEEGEPSVSTGCLSGSGKCSKRIPQGKPVERLGEDFPEEVAFEQEPERNENLPPTLVVQSFRQREQQLQRSWVRIVFVLQERQGGQ